MTTLFLRSTALQIQIKDFSPEERLSPLSEIFKPSRSESERWSRPAFLRSCSISLSEHLLSGSMLNLRVPVNSVGSCGMMVTFLLSYSSEISLMFSPSISIEPPQISTILVKARLRVDFPAPVLPTIPTFSPAPILTESPLSTSSVFGLYLSLTSLIKISPLCGHCLSWTFLYPCFSSGISRMTKHLCTLAMMTSRFAIAWIRPHNIPLK